MFTHHRHELREHYYQAWKKFCDHLPTDPLEMQLISVIKMHPEYHFIFENFDKYRDKDFNPELGETNPFLHLSMHQTIRDQVRTDKPDGMQKIYSKLLKRTSDKHQVEHIIMDVLIEMMWQSQHLNLPFNDKKYLRQLKQLINQH